MEEIRLKEADFVDRFGVGDYLHACRRAFELYGEGAIENPERVEVVEEGYFRLEMPAEWEGRYKGRKVIEERSQVGSGRLGERRAVVELEDLRVGVRVVLDADHITDMRTGAAGALGVEYLARGPVRRVGILGTGRVARALARAVDELFGLERIQAMSRSPERREAFAAVLAGQVEAELVMVESLADCAQGVDAVLTAVPTPHPILNGDVVGEIPVLVAVGGDSRTRQLEQGVLEGFTVLVDHEGQAGASGEFKHAREIGRFDHIRFCRDGAGRVLTVADAAGGRLSAAVDPPRLAYLTGLAAQDLCAAAMVYEGMR